MNWAQVIYQYTAGGVFFFGTLYLCFRFKAAERGNESDRKAVRYLLAGFAGYLALHVGWIILATP